MEDIIIPRSSGTASRAEELSHEHPPHFLPSKCDTAANLEEIFRRGLTLLHERSHHRTMSPLALPASGFQPTFPSCLVLWLAVVSLVSSEGPGTASPCCELLSEGVPGVSVFLFVTQSALVVCVVIYHVGYEMLLAALVLV